MGTEEKYINVNIRGIKKRFQANPNSQLTEEMIEIYPWIPRRWVKVIKEGGNMTINDPLKYPLAKELIKGNLTALQDDEINTTS